MRLLAALALLGLLQEGDAVERGRAKLLRILRDARSEKAEAEKAREKSEETRKRAEELAAGAKDLPTEDEEFRRKVLAAARKSAEDARCLADRAAAAARSADLRIRLTERALAGLKPPGRGVTERVLRRIGDWAAKECDAEFARDPGFLDDPAASKRLEGLADRLLPFVPYPDGRPQIRILKGSVFGLAACATSNTIYVMGDYLARARTDEELLILLGHELAHVQLQHYGRFYLHYCAEETLQKLNRAEAADADVAEALNRDALAARTSAYSVEQELGADALGMQMAIAAGADPGSLARSLAAQQERRDRREEGTPPAELRLRYLIRTHPSPAERLRRLEEALGEPLPGR